MKSKVPGLRLYRWALLAYPRSLRGRYAEEMVTLFVDLVRGAERNGGRFSATVTALRILTELPGSALAAHARSLPRRPFAELTCDVAVAWRVLRREPHFTFAAVMTLALGIGGTTAMFSAINGSLLRPPPFPDPDGLAVAYQTFRSPDNDQGIRTRWSYPEFQVLRQAIDPIGTAVAYAVSGFNLSGPLVPEHATGETVSSAYFEALGIQATLGRTFRRDDASATHPSLVLVSHRLWAGPLRGDSLVLGRALRLNGIPLTIVGVMPSGFHGLSGRADVWVLQAMGPVVGYRGHLTDHQHFHSVFIRLGEDTRVDMLQSAIGRITEPIGAEHENPERWGVETLSLDRARVDPGMRRMQILLFGAVLLVLLIGAANLANIMLVRAHARSREMAVRIALGADRWRVSRALLIEGLLLSAIGGALGLLMAIALTDPLAAMTIAPRPTAANHYGALSPFAGVGLDWRVLGFAAGVTVATGLVFSLVPGLRASRTSPARAIANRATAMPRRRHILNPSSVLVMSEVALATLVLAAAALLYGSWIQLRSSDAGFDAENLYQFQVDPGTPNVDQGGAARFLERILESVRGIPGIEYATVDLCTPPHGRCATTQVGTRTSPDRPVVERHYVAPDHFRTLRIPVLRGRQFTDGDVAGQPRVVVVSESAVGRFWPTTEPLGQRIWFTDAAVLETDSAWTVVGVVRDARYGPVDEPPLPQVYMPFRQFTRSHARVLIRTQLTESALVPSLRRAVRTVDPNLPLDDAAFVAERMEEALHKPRLVAQLLLGFAAAALVLAGVGIYGVIAQYVAQRRREMAIRCAVGATSARISSSILARVVMMAGIGFSVGMAITLAAQQVLEALLFGVSPTSTWLWGGVATLLFAASLLAAIVPIGRAWRLDPASVLRAE